MWESDEEFLQEMLDSGCVTDMYIDDEGNDIMVWNMELLEVLYPEIYEEVKAQQLEDMDIMLRGMVDKGLLQMGFTEMEDGTLEATYSLTELGKQVYDEMRNNGGWEA